MSEEKQDAQQETPTPPTPPEAPQPTPEPAPEKPAETPADAETPTPAMDAKEVADGKSFAILSYALNFLGIPFFLVPLIMRNNEFSLYHAKQNLILWIAGAALGTASSILTMCFVGFLLFPAVLIFELVLNIMGLMNATKGEAQPLPVLGQWGIDWFKGITKV